MNPRRKLHRTERVTRRDPGRARRRGVALLVILSLLVLFVLIGVTFMVVSGQYRRATRAAGGFERQGDAPRRELDQAMYQLLRDTENELSVIRGHSLLRDMYGDDGFAGRVAGSPQLRAGGQFLEFTFSLETGYTLPNPSPDLLSGNVLTFTSGQARGISTRIVLHESNTVRVVRPSTEQGIMPNVAAADTFVVNGRAFNGTGAGYDIATYRIGGQALRPNRRGEPRANFRMNFLAGGVDESYDAPDFQNMFLAALVPRPGNANEVEVLPSFHRPALLQNQGPSYILGNPSTSMRPLNQGPGFPTLPNQFTTNTIYDVDNDGDGITDSIWIDLGMPIKAAPDGTPYKPLFAILCIDLDGRLNLNAHGTDAHLLAPPSAIPLAGGTSSGGMPRGLGYGPPEIRLDAVIPPGELSAILFGNAGLGMAGRYGSTGVPGIAGIDPHAVAVFSQHPQNYFGSPTLSSYFSPDDIRGELAYGILTNGQPVWETPPPRPDQRFDTPYELDLMQGAPRGNAVNTRDALFGPGEMERLLRFRDVDSRLLPDRILRLAPSLNASARFRRLVTTHSYDPPVFSPLAPSDLRASGAIFRHVTELLLARGISQGELRGFLPPELLRGERMNLNRPFGNGRDDNNNYVVDEYGHPGANLQDAAPETGMMSGVAVNFDFDNDGAPGNQNEGYIARMQYARWLYTLLMALKPPGVNIDFDGDPGNDNPAETARGLAQFAVNVVDFRDADSIMTRFDYDPTPFTGGWNPSATVWGCERPELLITETLAWHARRTEDLEEPSKRTDAANNPDPDFDQRLRPEGAFFVELYNPWTGHPLRSGELYTDNSNAVQQGVVLNKVVGGSPVWRMLIVKGDGIGRDPDDPNPADRPAPADIERSVYFADPSGLVGTNHGSPYFTTLPVAPLIPGRHAVIGSSGRLDGSSYVSTAGRRTDADESAPTIADTRRIMLTPSTNPNTNQVAVYGVDGSVSDMPATVPAIAVAINSPRSISISEPVGGYPAVDADGNPFDAAGAGGEGIYTSPYDEPLDKGSDDASALMTDGTTMAFRTVHLQRLANPLLPFDPQNNPYLTIDSMTVDLTAFNGVTNDVDPDVAESDVFFSSLERGEHDPAQNAPFERELWHHEPPRAPGGVESQPDATHYFGRQLRCTLGWLNRKYGPPAGAEPGSFPGGPSMAAGDPFPWLAWNNRPFASSLELLNVPKSRSSRLLYDFGIDDGGATSPYDQPIGPFPYLLNFHESQGANPARLYRVLEFLEVPSRFVNTDLIFSPQAMASGADGAMYRPPFNRISRHRDPGKVNINTIYDEAIWTAIMAGHEGPNFAQLVDSRRGFAGTGILPAGSSGMPTYFANPFRASGAGDLVPLPSMVRDEVECTLLRSVGVSNTGNRPLFEGVSTQPGRNARRNPAFRHASLARLENLVTTRSNVFAVWITVGYFRTDVNGAQLFEELGSYTGTAERHRAFYLIDRSIPVAFEPGVNHNVDRAVLIRRYLD